MADSSRSPRPGWKRRLTSLVLIAMIIGLSWFIRVKELDHPHSHAPRPAAAAAVWAEKIPKPASTP